MGMTCNIYNRLKYDEAIYSLPTVQLCFFEDKKIETILNLQCDFFTS